MLTAILKYKGTRLYSALAVLLMAAFVFSAVITPASTKPAYAAHAGDGALENDPSIFTEHYDGVMFALRENWVASFMMMTEQLVSVMMAQMLMVGAMWDAKQQIEIQNLYRSLAAQAHKEYHPSVQMCFFGTNVASLAKADNATYENAKIIDQLLVEREYGNFGSSAAGGNFTDYRSRMHQFTEVYCDIHENNDMEDFCYGSSGPRDRRMRDVDFQRVVDLPYTIDANFTDADETTTEQDIVALGRNLFAAKTFDFMPEQLFYEEDDDTAEMQGQSLFLETRSVHAMRSVARRSFANIVAMKTEGDQAEQYESAQFLKAIVSELGIPDSEMDDFLGENPSYYAQMEVLTRKMYQSPEFYTNLYDKPENVKRTGVAIQALKLMQDRDRYESSLRREMLISLMVELRLRKYQEQTNRALVSTVSNVLGEPDF